MASVVERFPRSLLRPSPHQFPSQSPCPVQLTAPPEASEPPVPAAGGCGCRDRVPEISLGPPRLALRVSGPLYDAACLLRWGGGGGRMTELVCRLTHGLVSGRS